MAFDTDIRQSVIIDLRAQGVDALGVVGAAIDEVEGKMAAFNQQFAESGEANPGAYIKTIQRLGGELRKLQGLFAEMEHLETNPTAEGFEKIDVGLNKLIVDGFKFQDAIAKATAKAAQGAKETADAFDGIDVPLGKLIADGLKYQGVIEKANKAAAQSAKDAAAEAAGAAAAASMLADQRRAASDKIAAGRDKEAAAEIWAARQTADRDAAFRGMLETEQTATTIVSANTDAVTRQARALQDAAAKAQGFSSHSEMVANNTKKMSQFAMNASYAFQDMQYGIGAVANNVGLLATSAGNAFPKLEKLAAGIGGVGMLGAGVMVVAVAADLLYTHWDKLTKLMGEGVPPKLIGDVKTLEESLKKIEEKPVKTRIDYVDITNARRELDGLSRDQAAYNRLKSGKSEEQERRSKAVSEAIIEGGGTGDYSSGVDNVIRAVESSTPVPDSPETTKARKTLAEAMKKGGAEGLMRQRAAKKSLAAAETADRQNHHVAASAMVTQAAEGNEIQRKALADTLEANPRKFEAQGVDTTKLGAGLVLASAENKPADPAFIKRQEEDAKRVKKDAAAAKVKSDADDAERAKRASAFISSTRGGFEDPLEAEFFPKLQAGGDVDALRNGARPGLIGKLRDRGVDQDIIDRVADEILKKAGEDALNLINTGDQPKLTKKAAADKAKADKAHEAEVKKAADAVDQGFTGKAAALYAENDARRIWSEQDKLLGGQGLPEARNDAQFKRHIRNNQAFTVPDEAMGNFVRGRIGNDIARGGRVKRELIPEVAAQVEQRGSELYRTKKTEALGRTAMPDPSQFGALGPAGAETMATLSQAQSAIAQAQAGLLGSLGQTRQTAERAMQTALGVGGQAAQMRTRGPSASPLVRRGM